MFKKLIRKMENIKKIHVKLLELNTTMSEMKNSIHDM